MSFNYAKTARTARDLITKFGGSISVTYDSPTFDDDAGTVTNSETTETINGVVLPATKSKLDALGYRLDESVTRIVKVAYIDGLSITTKPQPGMKFTYSGTVYYIDGVTELDDQSGGSLLYTLALRV